MVKIFIEKIPFEVKQSVAAHRLLYSVLKDEFGIEASDDELYKGEQGKPYLDYKKLKEKNTSTISENIYFNLSHSGEYVMLAISDKEVGCDIQKKEQNRERVAKRFFAENEKKALEKGESFFEIWARKEALIKADGRGLGLGLNSFSVVDELGQFLERVNDIIYVPVADVPEGYSASVCIKGGSYGA